ncbi:hypothetical protein [Deferribacter abyssi]|uniref:hypothetical protein n=1 Tax=Deferribacter abyssi TaxID=213806 RepID=UPI003C1BE898
MLNLILTHPEYVGLSILGFIVLFAVIKHKKSPKHINYPNSRQPQQQTPNTEIEQIKRELLALKEENEQLKHKLNKKEKSSIVTPTEIAKGYILGKIGLNIISYAIIIIFGILIAVVFS